MRLFFNYLSKYEVVYAIASGFDPKQTKKWGAPTFRGGCLYLSALIIQEKTFGVKVAIQNFKMGAS